jgi:glucosylceramidase
MSFTLQGGSMLFEHREWRHFKRVFIASIVAAAGGLMVPAHSDLTSARWRMTTQNAKWGAEATLAIQAYTNQAADLVIDSATKYQTMTGFGGTPNEVGMAAMFSLPQALQDSLVKEFYDPVNGCRFNSIRLPIGCSDFSISPYTLDDSANDYTMSHISIDREKKYTLEFIKRALVVNPNIKVWGSPWTAPPWMKRNNNWMQGTPSTNECELKQDSATLTAYALYFSKAIKLYKDYGVPFYALAFQNEPKTCQLFPSMMWSSGETMKNFMNNYLGPRMHADHPDVELWTPTMNLGDTSFFMPMLRNPYAPDPITTVGFQYEGKNVVAYIHEKFPNLRLYSTELVCGGGDNTWDYAFSSTFRDIKYYVDNGASGAFQWNLFLEKFGKSGYTWNWNQNSMITIDTVKKTFTRQSQYFVLKHLSYYIFPGSRVLNTTGSFEPNAITVQNPDGSIAVVAQNYSVGSKSVTIRLGNQVITATMGAYSFASFVFYDPSMPVHQPLVTAPSRAHEQSSYRITGDEFRLPAAFAGSENHCAVFDLHGRLLREFSVKGRTIRLAKEFGVPGGVYVVNVNGSIK